MGINHPHVRWVVHFHVPVLLSEYIQEVGRAGRDSELAEALSLVSEPTGWLDSDDRQHQTYFHNQMLKQQQLAQQLIRRIPTQGEITAVTRQFKDGAIALALLHSNGQLEWQDPFHYKLLHASEASTSPPTKATQQMMQYLTTRHCRWRFLLESFGFSEQAEWLGKGCGHCDRCLFKKS